jgi:hypothetical protein
MKERLFSIPSLINLGNDDRIGLDLNFTYDPFAWFKIMGSDIFGYKTTGIASYEP